MAPSRNQSFFVIGIILSLCCLAGFGGVFLIVWLSRITQPAPPPLVFPTRDPLAITPSPIPDLGIPTLASTSGPQGKIVFVCQIFRLQAKDQLCLINADGTDERRLTTDDTVRHFYPSFAPDGQSVLFSSNLDGNFKIYEMTLTGQLNKIGDTVGIAPEVSPDNQSIAFVTGSGGKD